MYGEADRLAIIASLHCVNQVFLEESLELKGEYIKKYKADVLVMGDDWAGRFDNFRSLCEVVYFPRTEGISTSSIIQMVKEGY